MKIYSGPLSMFGAKVQIAALEKAIPFELVMVPFELKSGYVPKHPDVLRVNPKGQVPIIIHDDLEIFDSTQIFEYLEDLQRESSLWPADPKSRARARLLEHKSDEIYFPHVIRMMHHWATPEHPLAVAAREQASLYHLEMDELLADREFLAEQLSYADIAFYMAQLFAARMRADLSADTPRLLRWRARMTSRPSVASVVRPMARYVVSQGLYFPQCVAELLEE
ncbi:glutathione S-transferase family protein [Bradyrhizobium sp. CW11]|nr:glutathione S-transferase family protein [Bradyrhizobium sp. CW11]MCK1591085.1 glutathione S-transferase family protein [Bradyrhizobium sp. 169]